MTTYRECHYKLRHPCRNQVTMQTICLDDLLPLDHKARAVWEFVEKMDTTSCLEGINTYEYASGRPTASPKILLALWLYSIIDGNVSARKLEELCNHHDAYKWLAGEVPINRTMFSEFRSQNVEKFDELLTSCLAVMIQNNVISDKDFSQDGTRVKASAGFNSYHREATLETLKKEMLERIQQLELEKQQNPDAYNDREVRYAQERSQRIDLALENLKDARQRKRENGIKNSHPHSAEDLENTRASTTDPEARKMKMGDGGYRLAYNVQYATGMDSRVIFGVDAVNTLDPGTSPKMMQQVFSMLEKLGLPMAKNWCADSAYSGKDDVEEVAALFPGCAYYSPAKPREGIDPKKHLKGDSAAVKAWRDSLDTEKMKTVYKNRCSTAEFSNAQTKNQGMTEVLVRGTLKVRAMAILHAIAFNFVRYLDLIKKKGAVTLV